MGPQVIGALRSLADNLLGRGEATVTVPSFDGALKPNQILESAETVANFDAAEDLASDGKNVYVADGPAVRLLEGTLRTKFVDLTARSLPCVACRAAASR